MTATTTTEPMAALLAHAKERDALRSISALLGWDQETYMPEAGVEARAEQSALLAGLSHERDTDSRLDEWLSVCESDAAVTGEPASEAARLVREMRRDYDKATKLPAALVKEMAEVGAKAQHAWKAARSDNDFNAFAPWLEKMFSLSRQKAECYGVPEFDGRPGELYDALLDDYEPGASAAEIEGVFGPLRERLSALVKELAENGTRPDDSCLNVRVPEAAQHAFGLEVIGGLGFDLSAGRLDVTTHPFCQGTAAGDTRLTTRYREDSFTDALYGTMHECGHGLYEQGLPKSGPHAGTPLSSAISLGIHESQSRMWENFVGRSQEFWQWALPIAQKHFGSATDGWSPDRLFGAVNTSSPSLIRVEADESTYNLHVMIRFRIERALIRGDLSVADLPGAWNDAYRELLGVEVPNDREGCLQDVHWSFGLVGYFPTYTLGNLYAAQFWDTINEAIPTLSADIARGEFSGLLGWLNREIHAHGRRFRAGELCERITGKPLSADPLMNYLETKLRGVYGL